MPRDRRISPAAASAAAAASAEAAAGSFLGISFPIDALVVATVFLPAVLGPPALAIALLRWLVTKWTSSNAADGNCPAPNS